MNCDDCGLDLLHDCVCPVLIECPKGHGPQEVVQEEVYDGFAGGTCFAWTLACGHAVHDESDDVRAAQ